MKTKIMAAQFKTSLTLVALIKAKANRTRLHPLSQPAFLLTSLVVWLALASSSFRINAAESILLEFPALSQKDPANYRYKELMDVLDTVGEKSEPVKNLACAATVYTIIARGTGNPDAMIDDFYPDPSKFKNNSPGAARPAYVAEDSEINAQEIISSLTSRLPVILHGYGGLRWTQSFGH